MMTPIRGLRARRGFSLVEVMVAVMLLTVGLMAVAGLAASSLRTSFRARDEALYWGDVQEVVDSLLARGFGLDSSVSTWQTAPSGRKMKWSVTTNTAAPETITVVVQRPGYVNRMATTYDTVVVFMAKRNPGS